MRKAGEADVGVGMSALGAVDGAAGAAELAAKWWAVDVAVSGASSGPVHGDVDFAVASVILPR